MFGKNVSTSQNFMSKLPSMSWQNIGIFLLVVTLFLIGYFLLKNQISALFRPSYRENNEIVSKNGQDTGKEAELMLFYVDWCPHCKTAKPEWEKLKSEYEGKMINGYHVIFTEINCTSDSPEIEKLMNTYKIEGYPTIKLLKDGQIIEYDAKPSKATLVQFLNTVL